MLRLFFVPCSPVFWGGVWRLREEKKQGDHLTEEPAGKPRLIFHASLPPPNLVLAFAPKSFLHLYCSESSPMPELLHLILKPQPRFILASSLCLGRTEP